MCTIKTLLLLLHSERDLHIAGCWWYQEIVRALPRLTTDIIEEFHQGLHLNGLC